MTRFHGTWRSDLTLDQKHEIKTRFKKLYSLKKLTMEKLNFILDAEGDGYIISGDHPSFCNLVSGYDHYNGSGDFKNCYPTIEDFLDDYMRDLWLKGYGGYSVASNLLRGSYFLIK